jgi:hypothetical protein
MAEESDVARWHRLSGLPDNVTDKGEIVSTSPGARLQTEKAQLRAWIARVRDSADASPEAKNLARLATSYLLAGDVETARHYIARSIDA